MMAQFSPLLNGIIRLVPRALAASVLIGVVVACDPPAAPAKDNSAASLMPALPDYNITDTVDFQDALAKVGATGAFTAAQPEIAAAIMGANEISKCYQSAGAYEARVYVNKEQPLYLGAIIIVNRNVLTNPEVFTACVAPRMMARSAQVAIQPCANAFTLKSDNNEFYIGYAASNPAVCAAFCSNLRGCTQ